MSIPKKNNITGAGEKVIMFAHGFGCDQNMWRYVAPAFEKNYRIVKFGHVGAGNSDLSAYSYTRYNSLEGYAEDILAIAAELNLRDIIFVGRSVSSIIGMIAAQMALALFGKLVLVAPSPCYINEQGYTGGFSKSEIDELLVSINQIHLGWSAAIAPVIMDDQNSSELKEELTNSFYKKGREIAKYFARTTFLTDRRDILENMGALKCRVANG